MWRKLIIIAVVLGVIGAAAGGALYYVYPVQVSIFVALTRNYVLSLFAPPGTATTELNAAYKDAGAAAPSLPAGASSPSVTAGDWPSYNRTLTSERYSPLDQINTRNAGKLKVLCTYDVGEFAAFESGLIMVENALIGTTEFDIFSINPATCAENWRTHEDYPPSLLPANRGAAYLDGMLFRGTQDGRVLAYDFKTGKRLWETTIADPKRGESVPSAPIAWDGLVFVGNAGGDYKGGKGRMYALDAKTGKIVWEFFLVPKAEGDVARGPLGASPLDASTWKNAPGVPISGGGTWTSYTLDTKTGLLYVPGGNPAPDFAIARARGRQSLYRLGRRPRRQDRRLQEPFQDCAEGLARLGRLQPAHPDSNDGRQEAHGGRAEGWPPLRFRSRHQRLLYRVPVTTSRECRRTLLARQSRPFLSRLGGRRGMEQPGLRSQDEPYLRRRSRLVRHGRRQRLSMKLRSVRSGNHGPAWRHRIRSTRSATWTDTGRVGSTPSTPTPASGNGD